VKIFKKCYPVFILLLSLLLLSGSLQTIAAQGQTERLYYGIEANGVLYGYSEISISPILKDGKQMILLKQKSFTMQSALGSEFNTELTLTYHIDPATGRFSYHDSKVTQGPIELDSAIYIEGNRARFTSTMSEEEITTLLPPEVILENTVFFPHLKKDFVDGNLKEKTYQMYEVREAEIQETTYTKVGTEKLELIGISFNALILDKLNHKTGLKVRLWLDTETAYLLKALAPNNRMSYLTDSTVVKKIEVVNLDENLIVKVDVAIGDVQAISYMKVKATLEPTGLWVTSESLTVPGQSFTGIVKDNLIEGIFEIEHRHYDGADAPAFPPDFSGDESLRKYLEPEESIESDDPILVSKAQEITEGSEDCWQAAGRLSEWVAENITYAIPGGGTARKTYDTRSGECGAHSMLLAAFCRAVGIPARVVWGCMYTPNFSGSFGQHAWNEIYMGQVGWVPVDATAFEIDYVDSGHIRIGIYQSPVTALNPKEMEILDYRVETGQLLETEQELLEKYGAYTGKYAHPASNDVFKVFIQDGSLTVDIVGKVVLALNDPDEEELWYSKLSDRLYFIFKKDDSGEIREMELHELIPLLKKSAPEEIDVNVPEKFRPYLGNYVLTALQAKFTVRYENGTLVVDDPLGKRTVRLQAPDEKGRWLDEFNKNAIFFELDEEGNVTSMIVDSINVLHRAES